MARPRKHDGVVYRRKGTQFWWMRYWDGAGTRREEPTGTADWKEAQKKLRERLHARDDNVLEIVRRGEQLSFKQWAELFLENYSKPPLRTPKTHEANARAVMHFVKAFGDHKLADLSSDAIEAYLRHRLRQRVKRKTKAGIVEKGVLKPSTVHQELRVLRRILNLAVRKKLLPSNPCWGVEFPVAVKGLFRPHYVSWSEQQRIEGAAASHLRNVVRIVTETGLRIYKELAPMKKDQVDLENKVVWIPDSKTPNGVAEVPLTDLAVEAFRDQTQLAMNSPYVFPSDDNATGHQTTFKTAWRLTLRRAKVPYFRIYDLRSTYATRLSAGGVADEWVTQLLRQGDAKVFKKYSQMKLQMKREALQKLNRAANESAGVLGQAG
jgi:integrase